MSKQSEAIAAALALLIKDKESSVVKKCSIRIYDTNGGNTLEYELSPDAVLTLNSPAESVAPEDDAPLSWKPRDPGPTRAILTGTVALLHVTSPTTKWARLWLALREVVRG